MHSLALNDEIGDDEFQAPFHVVRTDGRPRHQPIVRERELGVGALHRARVQTPEGLPARVHVNGGGFVEPRILGVEAGVAFKKKRARLKPFIRSLNCVFWS